MRSDRLTDIHLCSAFIARLMDGRPKRFNDFSDIAPHPKTRRRWLDALVQAAELHVIVMKREGKTWWRMEKALIPTKVNRKSKVCAKCPGLGLQLLEQFGKNSYSPDGRDWVCRKCRSKQRNEWAANNRERVNAKQRRNYRKRRDRVLQLERGMYAG